MNSSPNTQPQAERKALVMKNHIIRVPLACALAALLALPPYAPASSHMDAPLITLDPAANTTDVYAFVTQDNGQKYLVVALGV